MPCVLTPNLAEEWADEYNRKSGRSTWSFGFRTCPTQSPFPVFAIYSCSTTDWLRTEGLVCHPSHSISRLQVRTQGHQRISLPSMEFKSSNQVYDTDMKDLRSKKKHREERVGMIICTAIFILIFLVMLHAIKSLTQEVHDMRSGKATDVKTVDVRAETPMELARVHEFDERFQVDCSQVTPFVFNENQAKWLLGATATCGAVALAGVQYGRQAAAIGGTIGSVVLGIIQFFSKKVANPARSLFDDHQAMVTVLGLTAHNTSGRITDELHGYGYRTLGVDGDNNAFATKSDGSYTYLAQWQVLPWSKRDSDGNRVDNSDDNYVTAGADCDNDQRAYYFDQSSSDWSSFGNYAASQFTETNEQGSEYAQNFCVVPVDTQGNPVFSGTVAINGDASNANNNCDGITAGWISGFASS